MVPVIDKKQDVDSSGSIIMEETGSETKGDGDELTEKENEANGNSSASRGLV